MQHKYRQITKIKHSDLPDLEQPPETTKIYCPSCMAAVPAADVNIANMVAKCTSCDSIFSIEPVVQQLRSSSGELITDEIGRPEGIELNYFHNEFEIAAKQGPSVLHGSAVVIFPLIFLIAVGIYADTSHTAALVVGVAAIAATFYSAMKLLLSRRNMLYITIDEHTLEVAYRPKSFIGDKSFPISEIEQAYVQVDPVMGGYAVYLVISSMKGQKQQRLIGGIKSLLKAKYLEQEIERYLGITNKKVIGELS